MQDADGWQAVIVTNPIMPKGSVRVATMHHKAGRTKASGIVMDFLQSRFRQSMIYRGATVHVAERPSPATLSTTTINRHGLGA